MIHCENCGTDDPRTDDGYTTCCNELLCYGNEQSTPFAVEFDDGSTRAVRSCCWGRMSERTLGAGMVGGHADCNGCAIHTASRW